MVKKFLLIPDIGMRLFIKVRFKWLRRVGGLSQQVNWLVAKCPLSLWWRSILVRIGLNFILGLIDIGLLKILLPDVFLLLVSEQGHKHRFVLLVELILTLRWLVVTLRRNLLCLRLFWDLDQRCG
jgi:hypothetical protein